MEVYLPHIVNHITNLHYVRLALKFKLVCFSHGLSSLKQLSLQSRRQTRDRGPARYSEGDGNALYVCQLDTVMIQHFCVKVKSILSFKRNARLHPLPKGSGLDGGVLTGAFLSAAIGQLYGTFSEEKIQSLLKVEDAKPNDLGLLRSAINNTKLYFKNPERFSQAIREVMGDEVGDV